MRSPYSLALCALLAQTALAQADSTAPSKTFFTKRDATLGVIALGVTGALSVFDVRIARGAQGSRFQSQSLTNFSTKVSKVNETTLTAAGILTYGVARLTHASTITDIALHATESVVLSSVASQLIRGPLGRTRPYVTHDSDQYKFKPFRGFIGDTTFDYRSFPSIHTSSSMAVATVLAMETNRRSPGATKFVAPLLYAAALLPGLARIQLNQHWASDIAAGGFMGVMAGYKVTSYSHDHPDNRVDRFLLGTSVTPQPNGGYALSYSVPF